MEGEEGGGEAPVPNGFAAWLFISRPQSLSSQPPPPRPTPARTPPTPPPTTHHTTKHRHVRRHLVASLRLVPPRKCERHGPPTTAHNEAYHHPSPALPHVAAAAAVRLRRQCHVPHLAHGQSHQNHPATKELQVRVRAEPHPGRAQPARLSPPPSSRAVAAGGWRSFSKRSTRRVSPASASAYAGVVGCASVASTSTPVWPHRRNE